MVLDKVADDKLGGVVWMKTMIKSFRSNFSCFMLHPFCCQFLSHPVSNFLCNFLSPSLTFTLALFHWAPAMKVPVSRLDLLHNVLEATAPSFYHVVANATAISTDRAPHNEGWRQSCQMYTKPLQHSTWFWVALLIGSAEGMPCQSVECKVPWPLGRWPVEWYTVKPLQNHHPWCK